MNLENIFTTLGLKQEHMKIYLASLEWGETIITNIARKSGVPRTSIYTLLPELLDLGLITRSAKRGKTLYRAADPEMLHKLLEQRQLQLNQSISLLSENMKNLKAVQKTSTSKPNIQYLEGAEGIMQAYEKTFDADQIMIQCFTEDYRDVISDEFFEDYFERFYSSDIKSQEIITDTPSDYAYAAKHANQHHEIAHTQSKASAETDFWVYNDVVCFVSFNKQEPYALVIEDADIANCMKDLFANAWNSLNR